jgi:hypothetical protein
MARYRIIYWHHIPSVVEVRDGEIILKEELSPRFQELIDRVAMRKKIIGEEAYIEGWRKGCFKERGGEAGAIAKAVLAETEALSEEIAAKDLDGV